VPQEYECTDEEDLVLDLERNLKRKMKDRTELEKIKNDTRRNTVGNVYK
jgi:hypothetical protein